MSSACRVEAFRRTLGFGDLSFVAVDRHKSRLL